MTITLNNRGSYSIDNTSKKLTHLIKECRLEMHEMKTELIDIQTALSKCRSSLINIPEIVNLNENNNTFFMNTPNSIKTSSPYLIKFKKLNMSSNIKRQSNQLKHSIISCSTPKRRSTLDTNLTWSSSLNEEDEEHNEEIEEQNQNQFSHSASSTLFTTDDESSAGYPSRSVCNIKSSPKFKKLAILNKTKTRSGRKVFTNNHIQSTPTFSWRNKLQTPTKRTSNYLYPIVKLKKIKSLKSPIRVYKHNSQRLNNMNRVKIHQEQIENKRNKYLNMLEISCCTTTTTTALTRPVCDDFAELCQERRMETSLLKCRPVSPIPSTSSSSISTSSESSVSIKNNISNKTSPPFIVINHKNSYELGNNSTIFEPNLASTPILREQRTSTPNLINTSYMDKILTDLVDNNHQINQCFNYKLFINENGRKLSFDGYSTQEQINYNLEDENDNYDIPEPHKFDENDDYKKPSFSHETIEDDSSSRNLLLQRTSTLNNSYLNSQFNLNEYDSNNNLVINKVNYNYTNLSNHHHFNHNNTRRNKTCCLNNNNNNFNDLSRTRASTNSRKYMNLNQFNINQFSQQQHQPSKQIKTKKNVTLISNASSVTSSVIKCCIRPFKNLIFSKKKH